MSEQVIEAVAEVAKNIQVSGAEVLGLIVFVLAQNAVLEAVNYHFVTSREEYQDCITRTRNLGARIKKLKHDYIYGTSNKKKQEKKMINVETENFKDNHR